MYRQSFRNSIAFITVMSSIIAVCSALPAGETAWPAKPVQVIVPASAGGGTDVSCRIVTKYLSEEQGQPVMVSNVRGAGGSIGIKQAMEAKPDGYTMLYTHEDIVTNEVLGVSDFGYRDFAIAAKIYDVDLTTVIASKQYKNLEDVKKAALANPGDVTFAIDVATSAHLVPLVMQEEMGIEMNLVDSGSMNDRIPLLISGQLDLTFAPLGIVKDYVASGDVNCLGTLAAERSSLRPDLPTFREQGVDVVVNKYFVLYFPKGTPAGIVAKCADALERVSKNPEFIASAGNLLYKVAFARADGTLEYLEGSEAMMNEYRELIMGAR